MLLLAYAEKAEGRASYLKVIEVVMLPRCYIFPKEGTASENSGFPFIVNFLLSGCTLQSWGYLSSVPQKDERLNLA
jgi:hypothetical protein